jgi:hypothetical protein
MAIEMPQSGEGSQQREMRAVVVMLVALVIFVGVLIANRAKRREVEVTEEPVATTPAFDVGPDFVPVDTVDADLIEDYTFDRKTFPKDATEIVNDYKAIFHAVQYLRTVEKKRAELREKLSSAAGSEAAAIELELKVLDAGFERVGAADYAKLSSPPDLISNLPRGKRLHLAGRLAKIQIVEQMDHLEGAADAGVTKVCGWILKGMESGSSGRHFYLVVSPVDLTPWSQSRLIAMDAVFLKVWPRPMNLDRTVWEWMPMVVALRPAEVQIAPEAGSLVVRVIIGAVVVGIVLLTLLGRRDMLHARKRRKPGDGPVKPAAPSQLTGGAKETAEASKEPKPQDAANGSAPKPCSEAGRVLPGKADEDTSDGAERQSKG